MAKRDRSQFRLVEVDGYREREIYESDDLEEMAEYLGTKTGGWDLELPEVEL